MHPGMMYWWKSRQRGGGCCGAETGADGGSGGEYAHGWRAHRAESYEASGFDDLGGGAFGVRRPLRFLAFKLELDERQVGELARILNELKTERAQAEVDQRRSVGGLADALAGAQFDEAKATEAATLRVKTAERLRDAVLGALRRMHTLLNEDQRERLAYLIRTGTVSI